MTADLRDAAVCDAFVGAMEHADEPRMRAVIEKYHVTPETFGAEYDKRYFQVHHIDIGKMRTDRERKQEELLAKYYASHPNAPKGGPTPISESELGPPLPAFDQNLYFETVRLADCR